jgi:very-short-patch-repair endonuclease
VLEEMGLSFLLFSGKEVRKNTNNVLRIIENYIIGYH